MRFDEAITVPVTDADDDLLLVAITAEWTGAPREVVYLSGAAGELVASGAFGTRYTRAENGRATIAHGFTYSFLRDTLWPADSITVRTTAVDSGGNISTDTTVYAITRPTASAPTAAATQEAVITRALRVDPATGDIVHNGKRLQLVSGIDSVAQALRTRLAFFQGEWFLDEEYGTPYFQTILGKAAPLAAVREAFRQVISDTPGVKDITKLELSPGGAPREFVLRFACNTDLGELVLSVTTEVP